MIYVQVDANKNVLGYSSNKMSETDIEIEEKKLEKRFFNVPFFYKFNDSTNKFGYNEDLFNEYKIKKNNRTDLKKEIAEIKLEDNKKDIIINNLIKQMAAIKVENMQLKGQGELDK
ncbi:hypothetical protein [Clostridium baratii]|uniref:hypothetical protein n=1 Tax=Clostridium baratii TaxID=1561 RepID=UPI0005F29D05|nr:hypothetical protein [Clostridium baratii]KJU72464.1 hypothetical protein UC77_04165 [Clostridium baratii]